MDFPYGETVFRDRRAQTTDPYDPSLTSAGDWDPTLTIPLAGAYVASTSSNAASDATRSQILSNKSLYLTDPTLDVQPGDRIRRGSTPFNAGSPYFVRVRPDADVNPWSGWQPILEIPLELVEG